MNSKKLRSSVFKRYIIRFLLYILVFTLLYSGLFFIVYLIGSNMTWYYSDFLYVFAAFARYNSLLTFLLGWTLGLLVISLVQLRRIAKDIATLTGVIHTVATRSSKPIELPDTLSDAQLLLQQVQFEALHSEELAREAEQRKNDLVVYLAHDLKTPLTSVLGYLTLIQDEKDISPELQQRYLNIATTKAQRLEDLINEFFEITRFNLKGLVLEPTRFNFSRLLEQVNDEFQPLYDEKNLKPILEIQTDMDIFADAGKLERVIDNLLRNAANYSYPDSQIYITSFAENGIVTLEVANWGDTIPEHKLAHIFEQFYRLDTSRSGAVGGSGLGLAIAKEIVERHGGSIRAASENQQIVFRVDLPQSGPEEEGVPTLSGTAQLTKITVTNS